MGLIQKICNTVTGFNKSGRISPAYSSFPCQLGPCHIGPFNGYITCMCKLDAHRPTKLCDKEMTKKTIYHFHRSRTAWDSLLLASPRCSCFQCNSHKLDRRYTTILRKSNKVRSRSDEVPVPEKSGSSRDTSLNIGFRRCLSTAWAPFPVTSTKGRRRGGNQTQGTGNGLNRIS